MGCIALSLIVAGVILAVATAFTPKPPQEKIGKIYAHINNSTSEDPNDKFDPFVAIYTVEEIKDGKARLRWRTIHLSGEVNKYDTWEQVARVGMFDTEIRPRRD